MVDRSILSKAERQAIRLELAEVRRAREWSQADLGDWLGLSQQAMGKALRGNAGPFVAEALYEKAQLTRAQLISKHHEAIDTDSGPSTEADDLSPNKRAAMKAYTWTGVEPAEYEAAHRALAAEHYATGIDPDPSYFVTRIAKAIAEARGTSKAVPPPTHDESAADRDDAELAAYKASQAARKKPPPRGK